MRLCSYWHSLCRNRAEKKEKQAEKALVGGGKSKASSGSKKKKSSGSSGSSSSGKSGSKSKSGKSKSGKSKSKSGKSGKPQGKASQQGKGKGPGQPSAGVAIEAYACCRWLRLIALFAADMKKQEQQALKDEKKGEIKGTPGNMTPCSAAPTDCRVNPSWLLIVH